MANCNLVHKETNQVHVAHVNLPINIETAHDWLCQCQVPYGTYLVEHQDGEFEVEFSQASFQTWENTVLAEAVRRQIEESCEEEAAGCADPRF